MNTKFFLLLLVFLLITTPIASILTNKQHELPVTETSSETKANSDDKSPQPFPWMIDWETNHCVDHHPDDDGKFHHFHFQRLSALKRRRLFCLCLIKLVLAIVHLSCFLYGFAYLLH